MAYIGVDLGGTKISVAKIVGDSCENATRSLIPNKGSENEILDFIKDAISKSIDKDVKAIGILDLIFSLLSFSIDPFQTTIARPFLAA